MKARFWCHFVILLVPSAFVFALPGAIFGDDADYERWGFLILPLQAFVTIAAPWLIARRLATRATRDSQGFPVVQRENVANTGD